MIKSNLVDANVWLALMLAGHEAHRRSQEWFEQLPAEGAGFCRLVQVTVLRLLSTRAVVGTAAMPANVAWAKFEESLQDERVIYLAEPPDLTIVWPSLFRYAEPTPKLINDSYLAAFALTGGYRLVTRDRGFLEFRGLDVEILR